VVFLYWTLLACVDWSVLKYHSLWTGGTLFLVAENWLHNIPDSVPARISSLFFPNCVLYQCIMVQRSDFKLATAVYFDWARRHHIKEVVSLGCLGICTIIIKYKGRYKLTWMREKISVLFR
jgi:hypothetical protein